MTQTGDAHSSALNRLLPALAQLESALAAAESVQIAGLNGLLPDLVCLEGLVTGERTAANRNAMLALRNFAAADLAQMEELLAQGQLASPGLDFVGMLGVDGWELVHSNFLGWLLDPARDHGTGDYFLKNFLQVTAAQAESSGVSAVAAIDWLGSSIYRERHYIDILIVNPAAQFLCAIENKIWSPEIPGQLSRYRQVLENEYPDFTMYYVFLTPNGRSSQDDTEREIWVPLGYATILELVEQSVAGQGDSTNEEARVALKFYATALREHIVPESSEMQQLARKIYLEHREAIELIYRYKPNFAEETKPIFRQAIAQQPGLVEDVESPQFFRFRSADWDQFDAFRSGTVGFGLSAVVRGLLQPR